MDQKTSEVGGGGGEHNPYTDLKSSVVTDVHHISLLWNEKQSLGFITSAYFEIKNKVWA
jgi:hypothetical protein